MAIDATVGGASADSYVSDTDADTYFGTRLYVADWTNATLDTKERALKWATRLLEQYNWKGAKATTAAALRWPRSSVVDLEGVAISSTVIPAWLVAATSELALSLIIENRTTDPDTVGFKKIKADVIELEIDKYDKKKIIPASIMDIIAPYFEDVGVQLTRR